MEMSKLKSIVAAVTLAVASAGANATILSSTFGSPTTQHDAGEIGIGTGITSALGDIFQFTLAASGFVLFDGLSSGAGTVNLSTDTGTPTLITSTAFNGTEGTSFLNPGAYRYTVTASTPTAYILSSVFTPAIPEPGEWAMLLAGIGMMGLIIRRRINNL